MSRNDPRDISVGLVGATDRPAEATRFDRRPREARHTHRQGKKDYRTGTLVSTSGAIFVSA